MGCCLGTAVATNHRQSDAPIASPFEEETVKEVLSETPIVPKNPSPSKTPPLHPEILQSKSESGGVDLTKTPTEEIKENDSEIYSYSESFSISAATTATVADKKEMDEDGEVTQQVNNMSPPAKRVPRKRAAVPSGELAGRKDRAIRPPSARRQTVPSPEKKAQLPSRTTTNAQRHRNVGASNDSRREVSCRRSRSPAVRGEAGQRRKVRERSPVENITPANVVESEGKGTVEDGGTSPEPQTNNQGDF